MIKKILAALASIFAILFFWNRNKQLVEKLNEAEKREQHRNKMHEVNKKADKKQNEAISNYNGGNPLSDDGMRDFE